MRRPSAPIALLSCAGLGVVLALSFTVAARASSLPGYQGRVERFTLAPDGEVDGLLLADGTEVETPPHLSEQMTEAIRPGDAVTVRGLRAASHPDIQAVEIEDERTGRTVVDRGLSAEPRSSPPPPGVPARREGRVSRVLHGMQGEVNGVLLEDGTIVRMEPTGLAAAAAILRPGAYVAAEGEVRTSAWGSVLRATAVGALAPAAGAGARP